MWDLETKEVIHDLGGPAETNSSENSGGLQSTVRDVCFSPDGSVLASGSDDETVPYVYVYMKRRPMWMCI